MKDKTNKHNIANGNSTKGKTQHDSQMEYCFREIPISRAKVERMVADLPVWTKANPDESGLEEFYFGHEISKDCYYRLLKKHPDLKQAHDVALARIARRVWNNSLIKKYDWNPARHILALNCDEYKQAAAFHTNLAAEAKVKAEQNNPSTSGKEFILINRDGNVIGSSKKEVEGINE